MSILVSIENLLSGQLVEGERMEFKEGWNPALIMRSVCAFANDFENVGSGYIVMEEKNGKPVRPVKGFDLDQYERLQKELIQLTAQIPFDDRVNSRAKVDDMNFGLMREHLYNTNSRLFKESTSMSIEELAFQMNLC